MKEEVVTGRLDRSKIIVGTSAKVGYNYAKHSIKNAFTAKDSKKPVQEIHRKNAETIFDAFTKLRGTALKLAQGLSMDTGLLPEEFSEIFTKAQYSVPPINKALVRSLVKKELGIYPEQYFSKFSLDAMAAASIGQVHRATSKDGEELVVKIQYPGVRDSIDSDLSLVKSIAKTILPRETLEPYFEEVRSKLLEETDYINEGNQIEEFNTWFGNHSDWLALPHWKREQSTSKLLTMTYLEGEHLTQFLNRNPSQEERNHFGQLLWDFFHVQINEFYAMHADSHPGNYKFGSDGRLIVLDFGCVKRYPPEFFDRYISLMPLHMSGNGEDVWKAYTDLEMIFPDRKNQDAEVEFYEFCMEFGGRFVEPYRNATFDFGGVDFMAELNNYAKEISKFGEPRGSKHFIYTARTHLGLYMILHKMEAQVQTISGKNHVFNFLSAKGYPLA